MKKTIRVTESELVNIIKKFIKEDFEKDFDDDGEYIDIEKDDIQDFGFDYEEDIDDVEDFEKTKRRKNIKLAEPYFGKSEWKKEWEKPYNPIKPTDLPLDKYLASKRLK
jgi:hypothetical protein